MAKVVKELMVMVSSYFEGLIEGSFKTTADGQRLFYPWGVLGKGYVLPGVQAEQRIRRFMKIYYMVSLPLVFITVSLYGFYYALTLVPVVLLAYGASALSLTRRMLATRERLRLTESLANSGRAHSPRTLWLLFIVSVVFIIGDIGGMILDRQVGMGSLSILFFGTCATVIGYMLRARA
jgi:hypothetical protein